MRTAVINTAAGDNRNMAVIADIKIIVNGFLDAAGADDNGNMNVFVPGIGLDKNINTRTVLFGDDVDILRCVPAGELAVDTEIIRSLRFICIPATSERIIFEISSKLNIPCPPYFKRSQALTAAEVPIKSGRINSAVSFFLIVPFESRTISSAMRRIRS